MRGRCVRAEIVGSVWVRSQLSKRLVDFVREMVAGTINRHAGTTKILEKINRDEYNRKARKRAGLESLHSRKAPKKD